jgi:hypothetical protein
LTRLQAKLVEQDDTFRARTVSLRAGGKTVLTPIRALHLKDSRSESRLLVNPTIRGLNEVVSSLTPEILDQINNDADRQSIFLKALQQGSGRVNFREEISLFVFFFDGGGRVPNDQQVDYLANLVTGSPYNDIITPPILLGVSGNEYAAYLAKFFERLRSYMDSANVMGSIPHIAHIELQPILQFYIDNDIRLFALDLEGKDPIEMYPNINNVFRAMRSIERNLSDEECCYLHGVNMKRPRGIEKKQVTPAKDMLVYEMGFNSFGSSHLRMKFSPNLPPLKNMAWILNRSDYGYYVTSSPQIHEITHEPNVTIRLTDVLADRTASIRQKAKMFNVEQQGLEARTIQNRIQSGELDAYLRDKAQVEDNLKRIKKKMPPATLDWFTATP